MKDIFSYNKTNDKFFCPNVRTENMGKQSLRSFGPIVWNRMVPEKIKSSQNINVFKDSIKSWVPTNCSCNLCRDWVDGVGYWKIT